MCVKRLRSPKTCCIYAWGGAKIFTLSPKLLLHIRVCPLGVANEEHMSDGQDPGEANHAKLLLQPPTSRKTQKLSVIGDFLLGGTKTLICLAENFL